MILFDILRDRRCSLDLEQCVTGVTFTTILTRINFVLPHLVSRP